MGIALLCAALATGPALASPDQSASVSPAQALEFDLDSYTPDQSLWSAKMKAKYTEEQPLAVLKIDRLNLEAPIYLGTDRVTLDRGLGHIEHTVKPGEVGNVALSGHRDSFFRALKDIKVGDSIEMRTANGIEDYQVSDISIVDPLDISVLDPTDTKVLTLVTCHPFYYQGYAPDRYIVRATPVNQ
jgi:sortase A